MQSSLLLYLKIRFRSLSWGIRNVLWVARMSDAKGSWKDNNFDRDDKRRSSLFTSYSVDNENYELHDVWGIFSTPGYWRNGRFWVLVCSGSDLHRLWTNFIASLRVWSYETYEGNHLVDATMPLTLAALDCFRTN